MYLLLENSSAIIWLSIPIKPGSQTFLSSVPSSPPQFQKSFITYNNHRKMIEWDLLCDTNLYSGTILLQFYISSSLESWEQYRCTVEENKEVTDALYYAPRIMLSLLFIITDKRLHNASITDFSYLFKKYIDIVTLYYLVTDAFACNTTRASCRYI